MTAEQRAAIKARIIESEERNVKRLMKINSVLVVAILLSAIPSASALAGDCYFCYGTTISTTCEPVYGPGSGLQPQYGWTSCSSQWEDCHDGTMGPCAPHCHIGSTACFCMSSDYNGNCATTMECTDNNFNGICDYMEQEGGDGGSGTGYVPPACPNSPLVINLGHGPYRFSGTDDPVWFDINGDGVKEHLTWTQRDSEVAFLVVDRNQNGVIDSGYELFGDYGVNKVKGDWTRWNGFEWLKLSDSNSDGVIDYRDAIWPRLRLWIDRNHDAISQPNELVTLDSAGVQMLELDYRPTSREDRAGNALKWKSYIWRNGRREAYYDVYFKLIP